MINNAMAIVVSAGIIATILGGFVGCKALERNSNSLSNTKPEVTKVDLEQRASRLTNLGVYSDDKFPFTIQYPKEWTRVKPMNPATRLNLARMNSEGYFDGFSLNAVYVPGARNWAPEQYIDYIKRNPNILVELQKAVFQDITVVESSETTLSGQAAYLFIIDGTPKQDAQRGVVRMLQLSTLRDGNSYHLSFMFKPDKVEDMLPVFRQVASSFAIKAAAK